MRLGMRIAVAAAAAACAVGITACGNPNTTADLSAVADTATVTVTSTAQEATTVTVTAQPDGATAAETTDASVGDGHCTLATLNVSLGEPEGAAGSAYFPLTFTNTGFQPCTLEGFPEVAYVTGDDGHQVGAAATQDGDEGPAVTLQPGEQAVATLQEVTVQNFPEDVCDPTPVSGLRVSLPGSDDAAFVPQQDRTGCATEELPGGQFQMSVQSLAAA